MFGAKRLQAALCEQVKGTEHKGLKKGKNAFHCPVSIFVSGEWLMGFLGDKSLLCLLFCFSFLRGAERLQDSGLSYNCFWLSSGILITLSKRNRTSSMLPLDMLDHHQALALNIRIPE